MFQPKRNKSNATYLPRDPSYGPSQIDHIIVSTRWASTVSDCKVSWGISCQRWGRHYDHGLVCATLATRIKLSKKAPPTYHYNLLSGNADLKTEFDRQVSQNLATRVCDPNDATKSLSRLRESITLAAEEVIPVVKPTPLRKRFVSDRTHQLSAQLLFNVKQHPTQLDNLRAKTTAHI